MMVPSRSRKTAADSGSFMFVVSSKIRYKLVTRDRRCTEFADHNCASVVCDFGRFNRSSSANKPEREECYGRISGTRDIENLARLRWNVMRLLVLLKKHHPVFPERNENMFGFPSPQESFGSMPEVDVV